jgi:hypothetical protein
MYASCCGAVTAVAVRQSSRRKHIHRSRNLLTPLQLVMLLLLLLLLQAQGS